MEEECQCEECPPAGAPAWVMTFADLMSLLMCFFVLLLSFSEIEAQKFKQVAGSLSQAFGVQREIKDKDSPKGTSIIAQEFSPGKPQPTPINEVKQSTTVEKPNLEIKKDKDKDGSSENDGKQSTDAMSNEELQQLITEAQAEIVAKELAQQRAEELTEELQQKLQQEIARDLLEVETVEDQVIIRIKEKGSFSSGSATLISGFLPTMERITEEVATIKGRIMVAGHTDDVPISTQRFRSNWELSSARAVSVLEFMMDSGLLKADQMEVKGLSDTKPLVENSNNQNRAKNRRVEIIISPGA